MGPDLVVVDSPLLDDLSGLAHAVEPVLVEALVAELAVEALHVAVLLGLAGPDKGALHPVSVAPLVQGRSRELGPVLRVDSLGLAVKLDQIVQYSGYAMLGYRAVPPRSTGSSEYGRPPRPASCIPISYAREPSP